MRAGKRKAPVETRVAMALGEFFALERIDELKVVALSGEVRRECLGIEPAHRADRALAAHQTIPGGIDIPAQRGDPPHPGDHDTPAISRPLAHSPLRRLRRLRPRLRRSRRP
eukprot:TRINITY_DN13840_c0_g1_i1.p2 TRINITY_DN13840_c0_g1~~TRINITY_DN13840_c0_g1_i1.p2  ORF type:complete len:112 (+),score=9.30 TRINITY_DN13840_c0_g1_i1:213-548(+)